MKVLFLPAYFYPEQVASSYLGVNRFEAYKKAGFDMVVYAPYPSRGVSDEVRKEFSRRKTERMYEDRMIVHRFSLFKEGKNSVLRAFRYTIQLFKHFNRAVFARDAKDAEVVFLSSTPPIQGILGSMVKRFSNKKFIYCLQDIFPDSLAGTGLAKKGGILWKIGRVIENFTYRNADKIIVISQDFKKNIMAKGVPEEKIEVVYNWVDEQAVQPVAKAENPLFEEFGLSRDKFTVVYAGNLGNAQNISIIVEAAKQLPDIQFALFGTGGMEEELRGQITKEQLTNMHLNPLQPFERVSQVYSLGDVCVVSCKAGLGGSAMPSKTWTIMSCGRPVLANFDEGELKEILEKNNCGVFTHAGNVEEFVGAIRQMAAVPSHCEVMGKNARQFILNNLTKAVGTQKYVNVIKSFEKQ